MKKFLTISTICLLLTACGQSVESITINSMEDLQKYSKELQELNEEDKELVSNYFIRASLPMFNNTSNEPAEWGVTVGEARERQKRFVAENEAKKEKERQEQEAKKQEIDKYNQIYELNYTDFEKVDIGFSNDGIRLNMSLTNHSDKEISGLEGVITMSVDGIDKTMNLSTRAVKFDPAIKKGESGKIDFIASPDSMQIMKITQGTASVKLIFKSLVILNTDGSVVKFGENSPSF